MAIDTRERPAMRENAPSRVAALAATGIRKGFRSSRLDAGRGAQLLAVDDVSLRVERGEIYGLLGANGSGKSTLIRVFSTLLTADAGEVRIFGLDIRRDELAVKRLINRVSVEASFFKKLSAMENLVYAARLYGVGPDESRAKIVSVLSRLGVDEKRLREPLEKLSRGMEQKVAIARAFLTAPMALLGVGAGLARVRRRHEPVGGVHRAGSPSHFRRGDRRGRDLAVRALSARRDDHVALPRPHLRADGRDHRLGAVGRHDRIHVHGAGTASHPPDRDVRRDAG